MIRSDQTIYTHSFSSPVGVLHAAVDKLGRVLYLGFLPPRLSGDRLDVQENKYVCGELEYQVQQYFNGSRQRFTVETRLDGSPFQKSVWSRIGKIGFGETITYGEIARKIGRRNAARAVGNAAAANPVRIVIPCHRVVPASGGLGHYVRRGLSEDEGRSVKRYLLDLESGQANLVL